MLFSARLVSHYVHFVLKTTGTPLHEAFKDSFPKYVDHVLAKAKKDCNSIADCKLDQHWMPLSSRCAFCFFNYDIIGTVETFAEDSLAVFNRSNLAAPDNVLKIKRNSFQKDVERTKNYFYQLTRVQRLQLYYLYRMDFEMFGYSASSYL